MGKIYRREQTKYPNILCLIVTFFTFIAFVSVSCNDDTERFVGIWLYEKEPLKGIYKLILSEEKEATLNDTVYSYKITGDELILHNDSDTYTFIINADKQSLTGEGGEVYFKKLWYHEMWEFQDQGKVNGFVFKPNRTVIRYSLSKNRMINDTCEYDIIDDIIYIGEDQVQINEGNRTLINVYNDQYKITPHVLLNEDNRAWVGEIWKYRDENNAIFYIVFPLPKKKVQYGNTVVLIDPYRDNRVFEGIVYVETDSTNYDNAKIEGSYSDNPFVEDTIPITIDPVNMTLEKESCIFTKLDESDEELFLKTWRKYTPMMNRSKPYIVNGRVKLDRYNTVNFLTDQIFYTEDGLPFEYNRFKNTIYCAGMYLGTLKLEEIDVRQGGYAYNGEDVILMQSVRLVNGQEEIVSYELTPSGKTYDINYLHGNHRILLGEGNKMKITSEFPERGEWEIQGGAYSYRPPENGWEYPFKNKRVEDCILNYNPLNVSHIYTKKDEISKYGYEKTEEDLLNYLDGKTFITKTGKWFRGVRRQEEGVVAGYVSTDGVSYIFFPQIFAGGIVSKDEDEYKYISFSLGDSQNKYARFILDMSNGYIRGGFKESSGGWIDHLEEHEIYYLSKDND